MPTSELLLKDVIEIKEDVHAGDFKIELSQGSSEMDSRVAWQKARIWASLLHRLSGGVSC